MLATAPGVYKGEGEAGRGQKREELSHASKIVDGGKILVEYLPLKYVKFLISTKCFLLCPSVVIFHLIPSAISLNIYKHVISSA